MRVETAGGMTLAGSRVGFDGLQINDIEILGVSNGARHSRFAYDARSRLAGSIYGTTTDAQPTPGAPSTSQATEELTPADFRSGQERTPQLDSATRSVLASGGIDLSLLDPPSMTAAESAGHKIDSITRGSTTEALHYPQSQRTEDGTFVYEWDEKGRLTSVTEKPTSANGKIRRILYDYDGNDRLVGRRAEMAEVTDPAADLATLSWEPARISPTISAAEADSGLSAALRLLRLLDIVTTMPSSPKLRTPCIQTPLHLLATRR